MKDNNIDYLERSEAYNKLLALTLAQKLELQKLNGAIQRKNYTIQTLKEKLAIVKAHNEILRDLPARIIERDMATGKTLRTAMHVSQMSDEDIEAVRNAKVPDGNEFLDELMNLNGNAGYGDNDSWDNDSWENEYEPSENPDSGKV